MNAVAITDAVQCFFLLMSFFAVPVLLEWKYGGFTGVFGSGTGEG
jgi:Na+/proline symporter